MHKIRALVTTHNSFIVSAGGLLSDILVVLDLLIALFGKLCESVSDSHKHSESDGDVSELY